MYRKGHYGINALLYTPFAAILGVLGHVELLLICGLVFIGVSRIPDFDRHFDADMDTHKTDLLHYIPISHRGFTHTVWFAAIVGVVSIGIGGLLAAGYQTLDGNRTIVTIASFTAGFGGIVAHILGDAITPMGVKPFAPIRTSTYSLGWCYADSTLWNNAFLVLGGTTLLITISAVLSNDIPTSITSFAP